MYVCSDNDTGRIVEKIPWPGFPAQKAHLSVVNSTVINQPSSTDHDFRSHDGLER